MKFCPRCKIDKIESDFDWCLSSSDNLDEICVPCSYLPRVGKRGANAHKYKVGEILGKDCNRCSRFKSCKEFWQNKKGQLHALCYTCQSCSNRQRRERKGIATGPLPGRQKTKGIGSPKKAIIDGKQLCSKCKVWKDVATEFSKLKRSTTGFNYRCKNCDYSTSRKYLESQKAKITKKGYYLRRKQDISFRLRMILRSRITHAIRDARNGGRLKVARRKAGSSVHDLGCSVQELMRHLESKFTSGMTWETWGCGRGKWHVDHIKALSFFDLSDRKQFLQACHYSNLQPMWGSENIAKGGINRIKY